MKISGKGNRVSLSVNGVRCGVRVDCGPWISPELNGMIALRAKSGIGFPAAVRAALNVHNNSDSREDYFERDQIRLFPGHALYAAAQAAAN